MEGPPPQYTAKTVDDYLEHLSKGVFQAERVARMGDREIDALTKDERVIRSRPKIAAVVHNANEMLNLERAGGFKKHLRSFSDYESLATDLKRRFKFVGDMSVYHCLWTVKHPVPEWHDWAKTHGYARDGKPRRVPSRAKRGARTR